jgi:CheY-like chemotaxis protein
MLVTLLRLHGHVSHAAYDAEQAIALARRIQPDIVLLDLNLSGVDGYDVARTLAADPDVPPAQVIALTGFGGARDHERSRAAGFAGHLVKPVDVDQLLRLCGQPARA